MLHKKLNGYKIEQHKYIYSMCMYLYTMFAYMRIGKREKKQHVSDT